MKSNIALIAGLVASLSLFGCGPQSPEEKRKAAVEAMAEEIKAGQDAAVEAENAYVESMQVQIEATAKVEADRLAARTPEEVAADLEAELAEVERQAEAKREAEWDAAAEDRLRVKREAHEALVRARAEAELLKAEAENTRREERYKANQKAQQDADQAQRDARISR